MSNYTPDLNPEDDYQRLMAEETANNDDPQDTVSRLSADPELDPNQHDPSLGKKLNLVDHLLITAPLVMPSAEFAERVMEAIRKKELEPLNRYSATGLILGLGAALFVVVTIMGALGMGIVSIVLNWTQVYQNLVLAMGTISSTMTNGIEQVNVAASENPLLMALSIFSVPLFGVWIWLVRRLVPPGAEV